MTVHIFLAVLAAQQPLILEQLYWNAYFLQWSQKVSWKKENITGKETFLKKMRLVEHETQQYKRQEDLPLKLLLHIYLGYHVPQNRHLKVRQCLLEATCYYKLVSIATVQFVTRFRSLSKEKWSTLLNIQSYDPPIILRDGQLKKSNLTKGLFKLPVSCRTQHVLRTVP